MSQRICNCQEQKIVSQTTVTPQDIKVINVLRSVTEILTGSCDPRDDAESSIYIYNKYFMIL